MPTYQSNGPNLSRMDTLVAAAIAVGRMPGEAAHILRSSRRPRVIELILGIRSPTPLADPRLEVIRAISASLARGGKAIGSDLIAAATDAGISAEDLRTVFPTLSARIPA